MKRPPPLLPEERESLLGKSPIQELHVSNNFWRHMSDAKYKEFLQTHGYSSGFDRNLLPNELID